MADVKRKKRVVVKEGKTKKGRTIYLSNIYDGIQVYIKKLDSVWLFHSRKGNKPITTTHAQLQKAADMAEVER